MGLGRHSYVKKRLGGASATSSFRQTRRVLRSHPFCPPPHPLGFLSSCASWSRVFLPARTAPPLPSMKSAAHIFLAACIAAALLLCASAAAVTDSPTAAEPTVHTNRRRGGCRHAGGPIRRIDVGASFSSAVVYNGVVTTSGLIAESAFNASTTPDIRAQVEEVLRKTDAVLREAGTSKARLLTANVWLADISDFGVMNKAWQAWIASDGGAGVPVRATVESRLVAPMFRVEIQVSAALP